MDDTFLLSGVIYILMLQVTNKMHSFHHQRTYADIQLVNQWIIFSHLCLAVQPKEIDWARKGWSSLAGALEHLNVSVEEARALWSLLAAVYHLGFAGAMRGRLIGWYTHT